ncbi:protein of unknown function [Candidatus Nitrosocosmicus franklandus]|uniref:Uncharacterized protein n=1 Tax=Candidatus Nitrosocosmicus franklandianus TaxID=1798806 RepID=A0A484IFX3_9ARCH|nr:protein of unknown function [Candidatus Nitrosocosmicus franklandus]
MSTNTIIPKNDLNNYKLIPTLVDRMVMDRDISIVDHIIA